MNDPSKRINFPLTIIALVVGGVGLIYLKGILMPLMVAFFLVMLAGPSLSFMKRIGTPSGFAIVILVLLTALTVFLLARIFYTQIPELIEEAPSYYQTLQKEINSFVDNLPPKVRDLFKVEEGEGLSGKALGQMLASWLGNLFGLLGTFLLILVFMIFLFLEREHFLYRIKKAYKEEKGNRILAAVQNIQKQTESYIVGKTLVSLITGLLFTLVLWIFGVKYFFVWGLLAFLLNFIPNIGSCIATIIPLLVALTQMTLGQPESAFSPVKLIILGVILILIQMGVGSFFEPRLLGERLRLSPLVVFLSFVVWGWLWGLPGIILSVPIMATLKIIFENVESLKPIAVLISSEKPSSKK
jgi:predicted PurR-regulated permease PerM